MMKSLVNQLANHLQILEEQVTALEREILQWHQQNEPSKRLTTIPGIGPITATALVASIVDVRAFSIVVANYLPGLGWFLVSTPVEASLS